MKKLMESEKANIFYDKLRSYFTKYELLNNIVFKYFSIILFDTESTIHNISW